MATHPDFAVGQDSGVDDTSCGSRETIAKEHALAVKTVHRRLCPSPTCRSEAAEAGRSRARWRPYRQQPTSLREMRNGEPEQLRHRNAPPTALLSDTAGRPAQPAPVKCEPFTSLNSETMLVESVQEKKLRCEKGKPNPKQCAAACAAQKWQQITPTGSPDTHKTGGAKVATVDKR